MRKQTDSWSLTPGDLFVVKDVGIWTIVKNGSGNVHSVHRDVWLWGRKLTRAMYIGDKDSYFIFFDAFFGICKMHKKDYQFFRDQGFFLKIR